MTTNTAAKLTIRVGERDHIQGPTQAPVTFVNTVTTSARLAAKPMSW